MPGLEESNKPVRPRCYFDVEVGGLIIGRTVFELYSDLCPKTAENFRALCTGEKGLGTMGKPLHYKGTVFHRVVNKFIIQGGDIISGNGSEGESIYGGTFDDESLELKHERPFLLSMANRGKNTNCSQFFITTQPAPHLDGVHVVFGQVISGQSVVSHIEQLPTDNNSRPLTEAKIVNCGQLVLNCKGKWKTLKRESETSSDLRGPTKRRKTHKKEKKNNKRAMEKKEREDRSKKPRSDEVSSEGNVHPLTTVSNITPDKKLNVPTNNFLLLDGEDCEEGLIKETNEKSENMNAKDKYTKERHNKKAKNGRRSMKGRGVFRYRSPTRGRSRSVTPPHWRQAQKWTIKLTEYESIKLEKQKKEEEIKRREDARKKRHFEKLGQKKAFE